MKPTGYLTTREQATAYAAELCQNLGPGWESHVFENLGWHYCALLKGLTVVPGHCLDKTKPAEWFTAFLGDGKYPGSGTWAESGDTPQEAVQNVRNKARKFISERQKLLFDAEMALGVSLGISQLQDLIRSDPSPKKTKTLKKAKRYLKRK